ncbi:SDR family NAD(P)-dependent oxidoreductase [Leptospira interrogans]
MPRIQVVGRACRLPGAESVDEFWKLLIEQRCSVSSVPEERFTQAWYLSNRRGEPGKAYTFAAGVIDDVWGFDPGVFAITPREARQMDPQQRLILQLTWEALEDAGIPPSTLARQNIGVYMGASSMENSHRQFFDPAGTDSYLMTGNSLSIIANRVSYQFDLRGPSLTLDTACSSSLVALDYAIQDLKAGKIDAAIVGGVNALLSPFNFMGFCAASMLSPDGLCRPFDHRANGYVRSEGGVVLVLQRSDGQLARRRVHGEIVACAMNSDGRTSGVALPSSEQQAALLRALYERSNIDFNRLAFVEAHGTGTQVGDPAEAFALGNVLGAGRTSPLPIGSAKSNVGHLEPASGLVGLLKAQLALEHGILPATLHVEKLNPHIPFDDLKLQVAQEPISFPSAGEDEELLAGVNNFGFGGTNVHVVIAALADRAASPPQRIQVRGECAEPADVDVEPSALLLSAQCRDALMDLAKRQGTILRKSPSDGSDFSSITGATAHCRDLLPERLLILASERKEAAEALEGFVGGQQPTNVIVGTAIGRMAKTAFVFSGNGAQWGGMGRTAFSRSAVFRSHFRAVDTHYRALTDESLERLLHADDVEERLQYTGAAQPLLFAVQVALAKTLIAQGLRPDAVIGHSVGEVAAAHISGALDLAQAVAVIRARSQYQELARGLGLMAAVQAPADEVRKYITKARLKTIAIAAVNSPRSVTVAGTEVDIRKLMRLTRKDRIAATLLDIAYPFHSALLDRARDPIIEALADVRPVASDLSFCSTVTGTIIEGSELGANYWWKNVREPVEFQKALGAAGKTGCQVFVEIGPRSILRNYIQDNVADLDCETQVVTTLGREDDSADLDPVLAAFARAIVAGARFDVEAAYGPPPTASNIRLPHYPWQNKPFRPSPSSEALATFNPAHTQHPLLGAQFRLEDLIWDRQLDTEMVPFLKDHKVDGKTIMPGTGYVEMALAAASHGLKTDRVELRDVDFIQALELSADVTQELRTRLDTESGTVSISSRARLTANERQTHMRARFGQTPSSAIPDISAPVRETDPIAAPLDRIYRLARDFHLEYGPAFRRVIACREVGDHHVEVELSAPDATEHDGGGGYILHPVDFDACFHGLNVIFTRLKLGENKQAYIPIRIGVLRVYSPGERVATARITLRSYNARSAVADFALFNADGTLIATVDEARFRAASLSHRLRLHQAAYHVDKIVRALPVEAEKRIAPLLSRIAKPLAKVAPVLDKTARGKLSENLLLIDIAARRVAYDVLKSFADEGGILDLSAVTSPSLHKIGEDSGDAHAARAAVVERLLDVLYESDLAEASQGVWRLTETCPLPELQDVLTAILHDDPSWSAESVMLLTTARELPSWLSGRSVDAIAHASATLEHVQCASPRTRAQIDMVAGLVGTVVSHWPKLRPLRVLQLGVSGGGLIGSLIPIIEGASGQYLVADTDDSRVSRAASQWARSPAIEVVRVDADMEALKNRGPFDLVVSVNGLGQLDRCDDLLAALPACLADGAMAVLSETEPDNFHRVTYASVPALRDAESWIAALKGAGFVASRGAVAVPQTVPGTYLLIAQRLQNDMGASSIAPLAAIDDKLSDVASIRPSVVILCSGGKSRAEAAMQRAFDAEGFMAKVINLRPRGQSKKKTKANGGHIPSAETDLNAIIAAREDGPGLIDIVYASQSDPVSGDDHMTALSSRTDELTILLNALGDRPARLWIVAEGGARSLVDLGSSCPVQTGVWSYGRTAINEFGKLDIRLVDFSEKLTGSKKAARLADLLRAPGQLRELVLTGDAAIGLQVRRGLPNAVGGQELAGETAAEDNATVLTQTQFGNLDELTWVKRVRQAPGQGEVEIEVAYAGLNFRDVMWSLGLLPEEALEDGFAGPTVGFECSGRVVRVGEGVTQLVAGDSVIAMAPACFASHVTVSARAVAAAPQAVALRDAATIPVAFLTACYALEHLARIRTGEWVLIHGAAGGVGLAAVQVAKRHGAQIIATAGTDEKRGLLKMFGADNVLDTRSLDFVDQVRAITGSGVNVVLNSLAGEAMERSLELVRPFGRFIELGKRDFYANTKVGLRPFRRNVSYFGVDADQLLTHQPAVAQEVFEGLVSGFNDGAFVALPYRAFKSDDVVDAFRLMQKSGHIGKILVEAPKPDCGQEDTVSEFRASDIGAHVVFGGTGGFGLEFAHWLADRGARDVVLVSRSGGEREKLDGLTKSLAERGVALRVATCDVTDRDAVGALLSDIRQRGRIAGIAHTAMVLDDCLIQSLSRQRLDKVLAPKVVGAQNLDHLTRNDNLDYFIMFSSAAAMFGNPGQASYVAANGYLDGLARRRAAEGHTALAVAWGAITDVGILTRQKNTAESLARHTGGQRFTARDGLDLLARVLIRPDCGITLTNVALAAMNWGMARDFLHIMSTPAYEIISREAKGTVAGADGRGDLRNAVKGLDDQAAKKLVAEYLTNEVAAIFRMPPQDINPKRSLSELGMDSLMGLELRMAVEREISVDIMGISMSDGTTINDIAEHIAAKLRGASHDDEGDIAEGMDLLSKHVVEEIEIDQLHAFAEQVSEREAALQQRRVS